MLRMKRIAPNGVKAPLARPGLFWELLLRLATGRTLISQFK
jgi:hypothetical protein